MVLLSMVSFYLFFNTLTWHFGLGFISSLPNLFGIKGFVVVGYINISLQDRKSTILHNEKETIK
jgi:hypothetical protein